MKGSAQAVRQLLQKSQHWADAAIDKYPSHKYFTSPDWKMAVQYAKTAQQKYQELLKRGPITFVWTNVEQRILKQGYPVLSKQLLYEAEDEMCKPTLSTAEFEDPIEVLQKQVTESHAQNKMLRQQLLALQEQNEQLQETHRNSLESATADLRAENVKLKALNENLLDEVKMWEGRYTILKTRMQNKLSNTDNLQSQISQYQTQLADWEQKWSRQETFLQHSTTVMQHALSLLTEEQRTELQDYIDEMTS
jgi:hypothetical protein